MSFIQWLGDWLRKVSTSVKSITAGTNSLTYTRHNNDSVTIPLTLESDLYVKKTGDTVTGNINSLYGVDGIETVNQFSGEMAVNDLWALRTGITGNSDPASGTGSTTTDNGFLEIATADNGTEPIYVSQYEGDHMLPDSQGIRFYHMVRRAVLLDEQGNTSFPGVVTASRFNGTATNANYATSAGTASKLDSVDVGSATQPIYLNDGVAAACTYQLHKTVPVDAKFTDTVYTHPTTSGNKHIPSGGSSGQILIWSADGTAVWGNDNSTTYSVATTSADGLMSSTDKTKLDNLPAWSIANSAGRASGAMIGAWNPAIRALDNENRITIVGGMDTAATSGAKLILNGAERTGNEGWFGLQAGNANGYKQLIGKPDGTLTWGGTDVIYTHPSYAAQTGKPTANQTPSFGSTFTVSQIISDGTGHVTNVTDRTVKIPDSTATQSVNGLMSASDKSKLDSLSYTTGTWTPVLQGSTTAGVFTYTAQSGTYLKLGKLVFVEFSIAVTITTVPKGYFTITGLPYGTSTANQAILLDIGPGANIVNIQPFMFRASSSGGLTLYGLTSSNNSNPASFNTNLVVGTSITVRGSGIYRTNS